MSINPFSEPINPEALRKQKIEELEKIIGFLEFSIAKDMGDYKRMTEELSKLKKQEA